MWNLARTLFVAFLIAIAGTAFGALVPAGRAALAQEEHRHHPPQDMPLHERFYSTWFMPDEPTKSCCNMADCYPTTVQYHDGQWWAMRREDHK